MRKVREVLRLRFGVGLSVRQIARSCNIAKSTVGEYEQRAKAARISWPLPEGMDDAQLKAALFGSHPRKPARPMPDIAYLATEMRKKSVTLQLLWQEYKELYPDGYQYTQFCEYYRRGCKKLDLALRQEYKGGEKLFVDYAGQTVPIVDPQTGAVTEASIFVAVLGASNYTYAEATLTPKLPDWIMSHVRAFEYFNGVPALLIPDNLKTGVKKPCYYEPDLNPAYQDMAAYYGTAVIPTRVRKPKDKAKVETGVQIVERWILAALRSQAFFSLAELNGTIQGLLERLNTRRFKKIPTTRRELFETLDRPALRPLPAERYPYREWKTAKVNIDYHIQVDNHFYSVPYQLVGAQVDVRLG